MMPGSTGARPAPRSLLVQQLCYVIGTLAVTMVFNVPLNDGLAAVQPESADGLQLWSFYLERWTLWNHVRGLAAFAASGLYIWALRLS